jgi:hypothetical protein
MFQLKAFHKKPAQSISQKANTFLIYNALAKEKKYI